MSVPIWKPLSFNIVGDGVSTALDFDIPDDFSLGSPSQIINATATGVLPDGSVFTGPIVSGPTSVNVLPTVSRRKLSLALSAPLQAGASYMVNAALLF